VSRVRNDAKLWVCPCTHRSPTGLVPGPKAGCRRLAYKRWGRGKGVCATTLRTAPRPQALRRYRARTRTWSMTDWVPGARLLASRDAGLPPAPRLPGSRHGLTMNERCLAVNHGQPGVLLTLFAVRSRRHSYHSQADNVSPTPVTRSRMPAAVRFAQLPRHVAMPKAWGRTSEPTSAQHVMGHTPMHWTRTRMKPGVAQIRTPPMLRRSTGPTLGG
jgi:hypothetical protein